MAIRSILLLIVFTVCLPGCETCQRVLGTKSIGSDSQKEYQTMGRHYNQPNNGG